MARMQNEMVLTCAGVMCVEEGRVRGGLDRLNDMRCRRDDMGKDDDFAVFVFEKRLHMT